MKEKKEFIVFPGAQGLVIYGLGAGVHDCVFRNEPLAIFLSRLAEILLRTKECLNLDFCQLDMTNLQSELNSVIVRRFLENASWTYALCVGLVPFEKACLDGPTNPLRSGYLVRLEEIFTKCFANAHIFGDEGQQIVGLRGLLTDFELNGGISPEGTVGNGFQLSLDGYLRGYLTHEGREPVLYQRFGELIDHIAALASKEYPKICDQLASWIRMRTVSTHLGFGRTDFSSPAKTELLAKLKIISDSLDKTRLENVG